MKKITFILVLTTILLTSFLANAQDKYYIHSTTGGGWDFASNIDTMDDAFGAGNWIDSTFDVVDANILFSNATYFVFLEGSENGATDLDTFLTNNRTIIENWVNAGGSLLLNAGPNVGGNIDFGFNGTQLNYDATIYIDTAVAVDATHPAFVGPLTPTATSMSGTSFTHGYITGTGLTNVLVDSVDSTLIALAEKNWGAGIVMFGSMTLASFHTPITESRNFRANLYTYLESNNTLSLSSDLLSTEFDVFPNPASDKLTINYSGEELIEKVTIFSISGVKVLTQSFENNQTINLSNLSSGIYLIKFESNKKSITKKIMVK